ncbi:helix-turn-helix domain-containing protein [Nonomuraea rubra]|uniref:helix-turn-helix domain-containing protein n=1 Tax=Nonomuraea rubra TaxID=46180 RepID=UPI0033D97CE9
MAHELPQKEDHAGARVARLRRRKRPKMTQQQLANEVGYSLATIKAIEQGRRALDRGQMILKFAAALSCHPTEITGTPVVLPDADADARIASGAVEAVHRALLMHDRPSRLTDDEVARINLDQLAERVQQAMTFRKSVALARTGEILPDLLRDLQVAAAVGIGDDRRRAYRLLSFGYKCAVSFTRGCGHLAVTTLAAERARMAVRETDDPLLIISAEWVWADEFIRVGEHDAAADVIESALHELDRAGGEQPEVLSLRGAFHLKAALNCARAADATGTDMGLVHAQRAAEALGYDGDHYGLSFGPSNVAIWSVSMPVEFGRGREAIRRGEGLRLPRDYSSQRRCTLQIDLGRAHYLNGQRDASIEAFLRAERIAPQMTRLHPAVRETVGAMRRNAPRGRLEELALRCGVI